MSEPLPIARADHDICLLPALANRHGLIAGATGTGKTVTLQRLAEQFSRAGVPVFMADVKGDLSGLSRPGEWKPALKARAEQLGCASSHTFQGFPTMFWDVFGAAGHPVRATISEMGPVLIARMLGLNDTQAGVLALTFRIADDQGLLLLDLKDLRAMLQHVGDNAATYKTEYGNISPASIGAIQRGLLTIAEQGGEQFFGEPALDLGDLMQTDRDGRGVISILAADRLMNAPLIYATFLLWLLSELFERLPEVGDLERPKLVFFFDEAHLLFTDAAPALLQKIEQVVRLIRSKGVGIYFVTQNPLDIPDTVLGQLGNRVQHALRAFTPRDQKAVQTAATTMRPNPRLKIETAITELGVGEALISFLDAKGTPGITERALVLPPSSRIGAVTPEERRQTMATSLVAGHYEQVIDRESAYERLKGVQASPAAGGRSASTTPGSQAAPPTAPTPGSGGGILDSIGDIFGGAPSSARRGAQSPVEAALKSAARQIGSELGRQIVRGVLGSLLGGGGRRR
jgi:hypothetical protein